MRQRRHQRFLRRLCYGAFVPIPPPPPGSEGGHHKGTGIHWFHQQVPKKNSARHLVGLPPKSPLLDGLESVTGSGGARGRKDQRRLSKNGPRRQARRPQTPVGRLCTREQPHVSSGVPGVTSFKLATRHPARATPTPRPPPRRPGPGTSRTRGARLSRSQQRQATSPPGILPGTGDQGAARAPAPLRSRRPGALGGAACRTHRAWPPCRPRRASSPRGRAPPAGCCSPPRPPAARAAAALCSTPWARGPPPRLPALPRLPGVSLRAHAAARRKLLPGSSAASAPPPPLRPRAPPRAGEGARSPPRLPAGSAEAPRSPQRPGSGGRPPGSLGG